MKIAEIVCTFPPHHGGMGYVCYHNAIELARLGHDVTVFTLNHGKNGIQSPDEFKVEWLRSPFIYGDGGMVPQLIRKLSEFDILHLHYPFFGGAEYVCLASKLIQNKLFLTYHMDVEGTTNLKSLIIAIYEKLLLKWIMNCACGISAPSRKFLQSTKAGGVVPWSKYVETGHGGVDTDVFYPSEKDGLIIRDKYNLTGKTVVLFVGNLLAFKGLHLLIDAVSKIQNNEIVLLVIGGGYEEERYRKQVNELGLKNRVIFTGPKSHEEDLRLYYNAGDFLVLPSTHSESFGLVALEAMATEKPVIISDLPGPAGIVQNGIDGFIVPVNDPIALREKIEFISNNNELRFKMGKAAINKIEAEYSWKSIARKFEKAFMSCYGN